MFADLKTSVSGDLAICLFSKLLDFLKKKIQSYIGLIIKLELQANIKKSKTEEENMWHNFFYFM